MHIQSKFVTFFSLGDIISMVVCIDPAFGPRPYTTVSVPFPAFVDSGKVTSSKVTSNMLQVLEVSVPDRPSRMYDTLNVCMGKGRKLAAFEEKRIE